MPVVRWWCRVESGWYETRRRRYISLSLSLSPSPPPPPPPSTPQNHNSLCTPCHPPPPPPLLRRVRSDTWTPASIAARQNAGVGMCDGTSLRAASRACCSAAPSCRRRSSSSVTKRGEVLLFVGLVICWVGGWVGGMARDGCVFWGGWVGGDGCSSSSVTKRGLGPLLFVGCLGAVCVGCWVGGVARDGCVFWGWVCLCGHNGKAAAASLVIALLAGYPRTYTPARGLWRRAIHTNIHTHTYIYINTHTYTYLLEACWWRRAVVVFLVLGRRASISVRPQHKAARSYNVGV